MTFIEAAELLEKDRHVRRSGWREDVYLFKGKLGGILLKLDEAKDDMAQMHWQGKVEDVLASDWLEVP